MSGWRKAAVGVLVCVVLTAGAEIATAVTNDSPAVQPFQQGVYVGPADPSGVASFAAATQTDPVVASDFLSSNSGWDGMDGSGGQLSSLLASGWTGSAYTLSLGVPMIPTLPSGAPGGTLAEGAAGLFDNYFVQLGLNLVAGGESNAYLRLGWEFDSGVYAWSATTPSEESDYAAYFQRIVTAMRSVPGENFKFVWNPNATAFDESGYNVALAYPGNAYVNDIGVDAFDQTSVTSQTSADAWSESLFPALTSAQQFAQEQNEPLAIPEWGVLSSEDGHGLGDDPSYVNEMITWMQNPANGVAYESYFDDDTSSITGGNFPNSLTAFAHDLGAQAGSTTTTSTTVVPSVSTAPRLGVYAGINSLAGVESFADVTGSHPTMAETYLPWGASTGSSYGWSYLTTQSALASWLSSWVGTSDQMVIGIPMVALDGSGNPENTLADGAAGDENANFVAIAKNLVALGFGNAVLRLGWEFDGTWYPWKVQSDADAANFATYWQNVVTAMRSVPGANFTYLWSPAGFQNLSWDIDDAYPGDNYVDDVSLDVYDWSWDSAIFPSGDPQNATTPAQSNAQFNVLLTDPEGLDWLASFAQAHQKSIVIPEWAVTIRTDGHGLGDDPTFINNMYEWMIANQVAWSIYFVDDVADNINQDIDFLLTDGNFPNALAAFETDFG